MIFFCGDLLALGSNDAIIQAQSRCSSGAGGFQSEATKKSYLDLANVIDEGLKPLYYKKYHIEDFLRDAVAKAPQHQKAIEESLNKSLLKLRPKNSGSLVGMDVKKNGDPEGDLNLSISQVFTKVGNDIPAVKEIADNYVVKLGLNANVDPNGIQMGQKKSISIESNNDKDQAVRGNLTYSTCDKGARVMDLGSKAGCSYKKRAAGGFETRVVDSLYVGGNFSASDLEGKKPEGYIFFRLEY